MHTTLKLLRNKESFKGEYEIKIKCSPFICKKGLMVKIDEENKQK